jgi:glycosyltransferase involved in cell wall biosynthesis
MMSSSPPKVAIVHEWFVTYAGSERVVEQILQLYPEADLFSLVDFLPQDQRGFIQNKAVHTSFIQKLPLARGGFRRYLPLMPLAAEQFDLSGYDLIISSSHAVAKGVITGPDQLHVSYVHSPIRYAWDLQHQYLKGSGLERGFKGALARTTLHYLRTWDTRTANGVDCFAANSSFIARRIRKVYRREAKVIYPPVNVAAFPLREDKEEFYLTASRMTPYKRMELIARAFADMPDKHLVVIGDGPDFDKVKRIAGPNVRLLGYQPSEVLRDYLQRAKAFVFAAEEDFGIVPVEAQACGTPVIAYGKGGALETVRGLEADVPTGVFFLEQSTAAIREAVGKLEANYGRFDPRALHEQAQRFSPGRFRREFADFVNAAWQAFRAEQPPPRRASPRASD